ncbi:MAG TPA: crotonyl-CoA carboxylase/reductase, partial [Azospirillaceae bacterium]|nr:crotonyl-CoA carboxylase/reductase [Azospirillaceae bacterium]
VVHCATYDGNCPTINAGGDQMYSPSFKIWGYETNYGSFAQFSRVQAHQCLPKPRHMSWEQAASYMLVGATAYRMLMGWAEHRMREDDVVLVWGGAGGLGSMAIQIARAVGAIPIAVISSADKIPYCESLGAKGCINRNDFDHWGMLPHWKDDVGYAKWLKGVRAFGKKIWDILGEKRSPRIVFEHPGETTIPTSLFVCDTGGIVAICAGTSGYNATVDLRYLWMRQKRVQGSHFANDSQCDAFNRMVLEGKIDPCLSRSFTFAELPVAHQLMYENRHPHGNMAVLIGAKDFGLGITTTIPGAATHIDLPANDVHNTPHPLPLSIPLPEATGETPEASVIADTATVRDLMHAGLIACAAEDTLSTAAARMLEADVGALVVIDGGKAVGMVSHTDIVLARQGRTSTEALAQPVRAVMSDGCVTCTADMPLADAISLMTRLRIHRLVVTEGTNQDATPVGVVSMGDVVRAMMMPGAGKA